MNYSIMIAVPSLIIWGFGIPAFAWVVLSRNKENLDNIDTREKYGFLYNGYKKKYYFWESVNMYRKISIIFVSVFLRVSGVITQALVIFLVLIIFLILNITLVPYTFKSLNDMEMMSIITSMLTIYCGLFYLSDNPEVYNSSDSSVQEADNGCKFCISIFNINYSEIKRVFKMVLLPSYSIIQHSILNLLDVQNDRRNQKHIKNKNG